MIYAESKSTWNVPTTGAQYGFLQAVASGIMSQSQTGLGLPTTGLGLPTNGVGPQGNADPFVNMDTVVVQVKFRMFYNNHDME